MVLIAGCSGTPVTDSTPSSTTELPAADGTQTFSNEGANGTLLIYVLNAGQGASILAVGPTGEKLLVDSADWRADGETVDEVVLFKDDLSDDGDKVDAVLPIERMVEEIRVIEFDAEETSRPKESVGDQFDRLSERLD